MPHTSFASLPTAVPPSQQNLHTQAGKSLWFYSIAIILALAAGLALGLYRDLQRPQPDMDTVSILPTARDIAAFRLQDQNGAAFTNKNLLGQWSVLFFGFTNCPDVCPSTLNTLAAADELAGDDMPQVILVSVDPERDTAAKLKPYVEYFSPTFKAVTGADAELQPLLQSLGVAAVKIPQGNSYTVDHSAWLMLIDPNGQLRAYLSPPFEPKSLAENLVGSINHLQD